MPAITKHGRRYRAKLRGEWIVRDTPEAVEVEIARRTAGHAAEQAGIEVSRAGSITVGELCEDWLLHRRPVWATRTIDFYEDAWRLYLHGTALAAMDANTVKPKAFVAYYQSLKFRAAKTCMAILRGGYDWAIENEDIDRRDNPVPKLERARCTDGDTQLKTKDIPTAGEVAKLRVDALSRDDEEWWLWLTLAAALGTRPGETCALRREHFTADTVIVNGTKNDTSKRVLQTGPGLLAKIEHALPAEGWLFPTPPNALTVSPHWTRDTPRSRLDPALDRIGIDRRITPHSLRHYWAVNAYNQTKDWVQVSKWLGHKSPQITIELYSNHVIREEQQRLGEIAINMLGED